jgi:hypothetical protein
MNQIAHRPPDTAALAILSRTEIETQAGKAEARPRDLQVFQDRVGHLVALSPTTAEECFYVLPPRGDGKEGIEGPSIRFAEIIVSQYANCRVAARCIEEAMEYVTAQGMFHDLETNVVTTSEVRRRIVDKRGRRYSLDMINQTANAACSIAKRNAILQGIPRPLWVAYYERARTIAAGDDRSLEDKRETALAAFARLGIDEAKVIKFLGVKNREEIGPAAIVKLRGTYVAIKDGELSLSETFPVDAPAKSSSDKPQTVQEFGAGGNGNRFGRGMSTKPLPPDVEDAATAFRMGEEARRNHAARTGWPAAWRDQPNIEAWIAGWDNANEEEIGKGTASP